MKNDEVCGDNPTSSYRYAHCSAIGSHRPMVSAGAAPPAAGQKEYWPHAHGFCLPLYIIFLNKNSSN